MESEGTLDALTAMTKINHNRPSLRLLDNYRRELKNRSYDTTSTLPARPQKPHENPMPEVSEPASQCILSIFDAAEAYYDHFSAWLRASFPGATKANRKKSPELKKKLNQAENQLVEACAALILEGLQEHLRKEFGVVSWIEWLQKEAQRTNSSGLYDILEIGIKPAFEKIDAAVETR